MAAHNVTLRALLLLALTLVSFFLVQGVAGGFECCYCTCYNRCKRDPRRSKEACRWKCFNDQMCSFSCKNFPQCKASSNDGDLVSPRMGVAVAAGGDGQGEAVNGTKVGADP